jgi:hypothetical protein
VTLELSEHLKLQASGYMKLELDFQKTSISGAQTDPYQVKEAGDELNFILYLTQNLA